MTRAKRILKDPLLHFLVGGGLLFALYFAIHGTDQGWRDEGQTIVVDKPALLNFMQYQSAAFQPEYFEKQFAAMSPAERKSLIERYVREEALVREARAMGLGRVDYVIRKRMVQKMMYLIDDAANASAQPTDAQLQAYFKAHIDAYRTPATTTFTHVFIDKGLAHPGGGEQAAQRLKTRLETRHAGFSDAPAYGDRFPYLQNYVDRGRTFIGNQFGQDFADAIMKLSPSSKWQGPIRSDYGWHLVLVTAHKAPEDPKFADVRAQVKDDYLADALTGYRDKAIGDLVKQFTIRLKGLPAEQSAAKGSTAGD